MLSSDLIRLARNQGVRKYFFNTSWLFAERSLRIIAGLAVGIWVARYLGPERYGIFSYTLAFVALFGAVAKLGLDGVVIRELVSSPGKAQVYLGTAFWLKAAGAFFMLGLIALTLKIVGNDTRANLYIFIIAAGLVFQSFEVVDFYFQSQVLSRYVSISKMVQLTVSSGVKLLLIYAGADLIWFVLITASDQLFLGLSLGFAYWKNTKNFFWLQFDFQVAKSLIRNSWPLVLTGMVISIYMKIDQVMIKNMLDAQSVGQYSAAVKLSEVFYIIPMIVTSSVFPAIINAKRKNHELFLFRMKTVYLMLFWVAVLIAIFITVTSDYLVDLLFGPEYYQVSGVLKVHIWATVFVFFGVAKGKYMLAENIQWLSSIYSGIAAVANIILNYYLISAIGILGSALATVFSQVLSSMLLPLFHKKDRISVVSFFHSIFNYKLLKEMLYVKQ